MKTKEIHNKLSLWSKKITSAYPGLKIRYEYNTSRGVFLVSLYPDEVQDRNSFSIDVMKFEDEMISLFDHDAPLFCDNEELFSLSSEAEFIVGVSKQLPLQGWHFQIESAFESAELYNLAA